MIVPATGTARTALPHSVSSSALMLVRSVRLARLLSQHVRLGSLVCLLVCTVSLSTALLGWQEMHALFLILWVCSLPR